MESYEDCIHLTREKNTEILVHDRVGKVCVISYEVKQTSHSALQTASVHAQKGGRMFYIRHTLF